MKRKEFIKVCGAACLSASPLMILLESCGLSNYYAHYAVINKIIIIKKSEFLLVQKDKTIERKFVLIKNEHLNYPICVFKLTDGTYSALLMECTHNGCELQNQGNYLVCPCHGSEFSNKGVVQNPPAESNLISYTITTDNENIFINL